MKSILLILIAAVPCLAGERIEFADDRYSLEFPPGWTKAQSPTAGGGAELTRESPDKDLLLAVHADPIPAGSAADLEATAKTSAKSFGKAIRFEGEPRISDGTLDGCKAKFVTLLPADADEGPLAMFAVFIDARQHLVRITATMRPQTGKETRDACLGIVKSFRQETASQDKKAE